MFFVLWNSNLITTARLHPPVTLDTVSPGEVYVIFSKLPHRPGGWRNEDGLVALHLGASVTSDVPHLLTCFYSVSISEQLPTHIWTQKRRGPSQRVRAAPRSRTWSHKWLLRQRKAWIGGWWPPRGQRPCRGHLAHLCHLLPSQKGRKVKKTTWVEIEVIEKFRAWSSLPSTWVLSDVQRWSKCVSFWVTLTACF